MRNATIPAGDLQAPDPCIEDRTAAPHPGWGDAEMAPSGATRVLAHRARRYVDTRFTERLTLGRVAEELGVSREHLCRAFRSEFDTTLIRYLRRRRIEEAVTLMGSSELPLKEIGTQVGFSSYNEFFRAFKRLREMTPTSFQRRRQTQRTA